MEEFVSNQICRSPLCVFCLSPPYTIRAYRSPEKPASRRLSVRGWRRGGSSQSSVRPRFKPFNRRSYNLLPKQIKEILQAQGSLRTLSLEKVLGEIQKAWRPSEQLLQSFSPTDMDDKGPKLSENASPILLRRRLSAPETIMRKHALARQRSSSQDSDSSNSCSSKTSSRLSVMYVGSDTNLSKKRDSDSMRRSTLLRRFLNKPLSSSRFSGSYHEWQRSFSRISVNSSPEHLMKSQSRRSLNDDFKFSPQHKPINKNPSPKHYNNYYLTDSAKSSNKMSAYNGNFESYSTSFSENTSTPTNRETSTPATNVSYTTFSNNSDSAYTKTRSNFSAISNNNSSVSEIRKEIVEETDASNQEVNDSVQLSNKSIFVSNNKLSDGNDSSTQTAKTTNVNVISNVQLSQSTLDLILSRVLQDAVNVNKTKPVCDNNKQTEKGTHSLKVANLCVECSKKQLENKLECASAISKVGIGIYERPEEKQCTVSRFSAFPQSVSMEVNMSSGDSDKESDTVSLVDSLEDQSSRLFKENPLKSDLSFELPDNSDRKITCKPTAFFIPIEVGASELKTVAELMPSKVKDRLMKRQQKREEKHAKSKQNSFGVRDKHWGLGTKSLSSTSSDVRKAKTRGNKLFLPSLEAKVKGDRNKSEHKVNKTIKRKIVYNMMDKDTVSSSDSFQSKSSWGVTSKVKNKSEKLSPLCTTSTKNEYVYECGPRRIYHKTEFNNTSKKIEILEIMECVETSPKLAQKKSRIPVLIPQKLPKEKPDDTKPTYLDFNNVNSITDTKLDQLIANILIETLNIPDMPTALDDNENKKIPPGKSPVSGKYQQPFDAIPEEMLQTSASFEDTSNNNMNQSRDRVKVGESLPSVSTDKESRSSYQGKAAVAVVKDEDLSSIPKGWITFYMLHKNQGSPDSTSDEGKLDKTVNKISEKLNASINQSLIKKPESSAQCKKADVTHSCKETPFDIVKRENSKSSIENYSSSSENMSRSAYYPNLSNSSNGRNRKHSHSHNPQQKARQKPNIDSNAKYKEFGEWSVTVCGTTTCGQTAPDVQMCLKFPDSKKNCNCPSQFHSGLGEDAGKTHFPQIYQSNRSYKSNQAKGDSLLAQQRLPDIDPGRLTSRKQRRSESSVPSLSNLVSSRIEPRPTRTSTKRYNLTRPKVDASSNLNMSNNSSINLFNERHYAEILKRFPELLSITGSSINQDIKK